MNTRQTRAGLYQSVRDFTVKIGSPDFERFVGTGFVVAPDAAGRGRIVTCAHVVQSVQSDRHWARVGDKVGVRFLQPYYNFQQDYVATVSHAFNDSQDDVVLLQLDTPAPLNPNKVAIVGVARESHGNRFSSFGFRPVYEDFDGAPAEGIIYRDRVRVSPEKYYRAEPLVLDSYKLKSGMSGAAVLDLQRNVVVGIVSMVKDNEGTALAVDMVLLREFGLTVQDEDEPLRPSPPPPTGEPPVIPKDFPTQWRGVPPALPEWTGREELIAALTADWLNPAQASASMIGLAGEGKTSLVRQWLESLKGMPHEPYAVFWWSFYTAPGVEHFLEAALEFLGVPKNRLHSAHHHLDPNWCIYLLLCASHRVLFVLDGLERVQEDLGEDLGTFSSPAMRNFLQAFATLDHPAFLVMTSRLPVTDLLAYPAHHAYDVTNLTTVEGRAYLRRVGVRGTDAELDELVQAWAGHAHSLNYVARYILDDCDGEARYAIKDAIRPEANLPAHRLPLRAIEFYHRLLDFPEMNFLELCSLFHTPVTDDVVRVLFRGIYADLQTGVTAPRKRSSNRLNEALMRLDDTAFMKLVQRLCDCRLLGYDPEVGRYQIHPLVQAFYAHHLEQERIFNGIDRMEGALQDIGNYYADCARTQLANTITLADLTPQIDLYDYLVRAGRLDEAFELFYKRLANPLYFQFGVYQLAIELLSALVLTGEAASPRLKSESARGWTLNELANCYAMSGQPRRAVPLYKLANDIHDKADKADGKINRPIGLGNLANMAQLPIGSLNAAEANLRRNVALSRDIGDEFHEAVGHLELGQLLTYLGAWADAEQELLTSQKTFDNMGVRRTNSSSVNWAYRSVRTLLMARAIPLQATDHYQLAINYARRALALAEERAKIRAPTQDDFIRAHWLLGASLCVSGELAESETHLSEALQRCWANNAINHEANILLHFARLRLAQGISEEALRLAQEALVIAERSGYVLQGADVHLFFAQQDALSLKNLTGLTPLEHAREALRLATCDGEPYVYRVAYDEAAALVKKLEANT